MLGALWVLSNNLTWTLQTSGMTVNSILQINWDSRRLDDWTAGLDNLEFRTSRLPSRLFSLYCKMFSMLNKIDSQKHWFLAFNTFFCAIFDYLKSKQIAFLWNFANLQAYFYFHFECENLQDYMMSLWRAGTLKIILSSFQDVSAFLKCITILLTQLHLTLAQGLFFFFLSYRPSLANRLLYSIQVLTGVKIHLQLETSENPTKDGLNHKQILLTIRTRDSRSINCQEPMRSSSLRLTSEVGLLSPTGRPWFSFVSFLSINLCLPGDRTVQTALDSYPSFSLKPTQRKMIS